MRVLLTLTDLEPAVRLNAVLEAQGLETSLVSPVDDVRAVLRRFRPDVVVLTGASRIRRSTFSLRSGKCSSSQCSNSGATAHGRRIIV